MTTAVAKHFGVTLGNKLVRLRGLGKRTGAMSESVPIDVDKWRCTIRFVVVDEFPFAICLGLRDVLRIPVYRRGLLQYFRLSRYDTYQETIPVATTTPITQKDVTSGIDESKSNEELIQDAKETVWGRYNQERGTELFERIWQIFLKNKECWLRPRAGLYNGPPAKIIPLGEPVRVQRRPLSPELKNVLEDQLASQLKGRVISPSKSPWASPVHFVKKKDGSWRVVIDYRLANQRIKPDTYPLPLINEILKETSGHQYYIGLDLKWGFWQIPLESPGNEVTAFITHKGLFHFNVLPFGMRNSPAEFQRATDFAFQHLAARGHRIYIDDSVTFGNDLDTVLQCFDEVLQACVARGLFVNLQKVSILPYELDLLGHCVGPNGYRASPKRITGLQNAKVPQNKSELRSFLSAASYIREFVPNFSDYTAAFRPLLQTKANWKWTIEHENAFFILLQALCDRVYLNGPKGRGVFVLVCDASSYAIGCALLQEQDGELVLLGFYSRGLSTTERKWDTREREAFAVKWSVERCADIIRGHKIIAFTDHSSLKWAKDAPQSKIQRWMWFLQQFDLKIMHLSGKYNVLADWLSRCNVFEQCDDEFIETASVPLIAAAVPFTALQFPTVKDLQGEIEHVSFEERRQCYLGRDQLLYSIRTQKLFIPERYRLVIIHWAHAGPHGGHRGVTATSRRLRKYVWWSNLPRDVQEYCKSCLPCVRNRPPIRSTSTMVLRRPAALELVSADYVGPRVINGETWYYLVLIDHCTRFSQAYATQKADSAFAVSVLRDHWLPVLGAPKVLLSDNGTPFKGEFRTYVTKDLMAHCVYTSPYYPQGNAINESCHKVFEHMLCCELQLPNRNFPILVRQATIAYNATYQSEVGDAPFALMFGKPPILPGFQSLSTTYSEEVRLSQLTDANQRRMFRYWKEQQIPDGVEAADTKLEANDIVVFPLGEGEKRARSDATGVTKYTVSWSLPSRVNRVNENQAEVQEYITGYSRRVPVSQCRKLPKNIPAPLRQINWEHIQHTLPRRWKLPDSSSTFDSYAQLERKTGEDIISLEQGECEGTSQEEGLSTELSLPQKRRHSGAAGEGEYSLSIKPFVEVSVTDVPECPQKSSPISTLGADVDKAPHKE